MSGLRVRRYLEGQLVDEHALDRVRDLGAAHGEWALACTEAGLSWRVVLDDPTMERLSAEIVLEGGPS